MTFQNVLDAFFAPESQDAFAQSQGYEDADQMVYYENMNMEVPPMTDREAEEFVEREEALAKEDGTVEYLAPPPSEILVLMKEDPREVYRDAQWDAEVQDIVKRAEQKRLDELARLHELAKVDSREVYEDLTDWQDLAGVY